VRTCWRLLCPQVLAVSCRPFDREIMPQRAYTSESSKKDRRAWNSVRTRDEGHYLKYGGESEIGDRSRNCTHFPVSDHSSIEETSAETCGGLGLFYYSQFRYMFQVFTFNSFFTFCVHLLFLLIMLNERAAPSASNQLLTSYGKASMWAGISLRDGDRDSQIRSDFLQSCLSFENPHPISLAR